MEALRANRGVHSSELSRTQAGLCEALCGLIRTAPPHADMPHHQSASRTQKNTGQLAQCFLILRIVRVETLPGTAPCGQYMEALRANRGVHASGLSRTQAGL